jgi:acyl carrier protein
MRDKLMSFSIDMVAKLSNAPVEDVDINKPIMDLGLSSLSLSELAFGLSDEFQLEVPFAVVAEGASLTELVDVLVSESKAVDNVRV